MKKKWKLEILLLSLLIDIPISNAQENCSDVAGNSVNCNTVINSTVKYLRDIRINSDSVSIGDSAFTPETVLKFTNAEIKTGVAGNVANQPIVYKGCEVPSIEELNWSNGSLVCQAEAYEVGNFQIAMKAIGSTQLPHGYGRHVYDQSSSNDAVAKNYAKGNSYFECNNGKWVKSGSNMCSYGHCDPYYFGYTKFDPIFGCSLTRVIKPDDTKPYVVYLNHGESSWYRNYKIDNLNHDGLLVMTCDKGTLVHNEDDVCKPRKCPAGPQLWWATEGPTYNPNYGKTDYAYYTPIVYGDGFYIPHSYAPLANWFYKCQADFPEMDHGEMMTLPDKKNPLNYIRVECRGGQRLTMHSVGHH